MNNPFLQLKRYRCDANDTIDARENHATECLAACLVFSSKIRLAFIQFLLEGQVTFDKNDASEIDVVSQKAIESGDIDLVLELLGRFVIAIEVKVGSPENCPHHREQLRKYRAWLNRKNDSHGYLFTLVRIPDNRFFPDQFGANGRRTWHDLEQHFLKLRRCGALTEVEISLIENLCKYLESESIVSAYDTNDLLSYSAGLKAQEAVKGVFGQVAERLRPEGFSTNVVAGKKDFWHNSRLDNPNGKESSERGKTKR